MEENSEGTDNENHWKRIKGEGEQLQGAATSKAARIRKSDIFRRSRGKDSWGNHKNKIGNVGCWKQLGKERHCLCGEKETTEHILECWKVREIVKKKAAKNWLQSGRGEELGQATEYIKTYMANREN